MKKITKRDKELGTFHFYLTVEPSGEQFIDIRNTWKEDRRGRSVTVPVAMLEKALAKLKEEEARERGEEELTELRAKPEVPSKDEPKASCGGSREALIEEIKKKGFPVMVTRGEMDAGAGVYAFSEGHAVPIEVYGECAFDYGYMDGGALLDVRAEYLALLAEEGSRPGEPCWDEEAKKEAEEKLAKIKSA